MEACRRAGKGWGRSAPTFGAAVKPKRGPRARDKAANTTGASGRAVATLVHRPSLGGWRVHALGDYLPPESVPHDL